jgi:Ser/Thr protein kinase RdoA (MazF antagonist)
MHPWNVVVHRGEVRVLDTEDCGWGYYAFDVGVVLFELLQTWPQRYAVMRDSLLGGYRKMRAIDAEPRDVAPFFAMRMVDIALWHAQVCRPERIQSWVEFCSTALRGMVK